MKSTIAITYEDSFWERLSTCDGNSVPFLSLFPKWYLISGGSGAGLPLLSSTRNCQRSTFPDPFWIFLAQDRLRQSQQPLFPCWCSSRNQHVWSQPLRLWLLLFFSVSAVTDKVSFSSLISEPNASFSFWCCRRLSKIVFSITGNESSLRVCLLRLSFASHFSAACGAFA